MWPTKTKTFFSTRLFFKKLLVPGFKDLNYSFEFLFNSNAFGHASYNPGLGAASS